jgi:cyclopropane fatty-acyl-phospholipid synthase-like methyltransferase
LQKQGIKIIDGYGETPLSTFSKMAQAAEISSKDHYIELGSGRGKTCIWAALFLGCSVTGYEWVPLFADLSKALCRLLRLPAQFEQVSLFKADLSQATVVYVY